MKRKIVALILCLMMVLMTLPTVASAETKATRTTPDLSFDTKTIYGVSISSDIIKNYSLVFVNCWAEWCDYCVQEMPDLERLHQEYPNVLFLGVVTDPNSMEGVKSVVEETGVTYPILEPSGTLNKYAGICENNGWPSSFFFNNKGMQVGNELYVGARSYASWKSIIDSLLPDAGSVPSITTQPSNKTVNAGQTATFKVVATNATRYQWYYLKPGTNSWTAVSAESGKTATYSLTAEARHNGYKYRCNVSNAAGSVTSNTVTLTVKAPPTITTQPSSKTVDVGATATFKVVATGATGYQWYYLKPGTNSWTAVSADSGKTATYSLTAEARHNGYKYRCKVSNAAGSVMSNTVTLTVKVPPTITTQPSSKTVNEGQTATFKVVATGATGYQWYYLKPGTSSWEAVSADSGKTATYSLTAEARHNGYKYRCKVSNAVGSVTSNTVKLTVKVPPTITTQPSNKTVNAGATATFKVVATNATTYQWYYLKPGTNSWTAVSAESGKTATYSLTAEARHNGYKYRCKVSNAAGSVTSKTVTLTVIVPPSMTTQPSSKTVNIGETATFKVVATNATTYQWYYLKPGASSWTAVSAESGKTATYSLTAEARHNGYKYRCKISNAAGSVTSNTATLTVKVPPTITTQPSSKTVNEGQTATFKVVATNATTYQWYYLKPGTSSWVAVSADSGKTATYSLTTQAKHNGYKYRCVVSNAAGSVKSNTVTLTVKLKPTITTQPSNKTVNEGQTATFKVVATNATTYQWYYLKPGTSSWVAVSSDNGKKASYSLTAQERHNGYKYRCVVSNAVGSVKSNTVTLTVLPAQVIEVSDLSYWFGNWTGYSGFDYSDGYRIPLDRYLKFYDSEEAQYWYDQMGEWGGNCYGMSTTSGFLYSDSASLNPSWFGKTRTYDINQHDYSNGIGGDATYMIECAQIMQMADDLWDYYYCDIQTVIDEVKKGAKAGEPAIVCVFGNWGGHALLGYKVEKVSSTETRVYIYDCNFPNNANRYITVTTNTSGTPTGWSYLVNDQMACEEIRVVPLSANLNVWANQGGFARSNKLCTDSLNYTILNSNGKIVGRMINGRFKSMQKDVRQMRFVDMNPKNAVISLPTGTYTIVNDGLKPMKMDMVHGQRRAIVSIESGSVTVRVDDVKGVNEVCMNRDVHGQFSVKLTSEKDICHKVEYSGISNGTEVTVGIVNNQLKLNGSVEGASLKVNDEELPY